eukprot:jgi/Bigna1/135202/aug1.28_g9910
MRVVSLPVSGSLKTGPTGELWEVALGSKKPVVAVPVGRIFGGKLESSIKNAIGLSQKQTEHQSSRTRGNQSNPNGPRTQATEEEAEERGAACKRAQALQHEEDEEGEFSREN